MFNLRIYSGPLLLLILFHIKTLTGLPYEVPPAPVAQPVPAPAPQLDVGLPASPNNNPSEGVPTEARTLNVSNSEPSLRALNASNAEASSGVAPRSAPTNPSAPVQQEDVAARNGFGDLNQETPPAAVAGAGSVPQQRIDTAQVNSNVSADTAPAVRSALEGLNNNNVSNVEQRSLNVSAPSPSEQVKVRVEAVAASPAPETINISNGGGNPFVPSFLKSFSLRQKRGEEALLAAESVSNNNNAGKQEEIQQQVNNAPKVEVRNLEDSVDAIAADPRGNFNVAPNDANLASRMVNLNPADSSSLLDMPYVNVYPRDAVVY